MKDTFRVVDSGGLFAANYLPITKNELAELRNNIRGKDRNPHGNALNDQYHELLPRDVNYTGKELVKIYHLL